MRSKLTTFILFLLMIFLIGAIGLIVWIIYNDLTTEDFLETFQISNMMISIDEDIIGQNTYENTVPLNTVATNNTNFNTNSTENNNSESTNNNFFYGQLDETEKIIYNGFQQNKENMKSGIYTIQFGEQFSDILEQENGKELLGDFYQSAIDAYMHDNPDLFYLDVSKLYLNIETTKKTFSTKHNVYIGPREGETYYNENYSSEVEVYTAISKVETVKNSVLSRLTDDDYENIKIIHDYLIDTIEYDENYESLEPYSLYGALVEKRVVCEGYAKAFKYLADAAGIRCELVQGTATNSDGVTENHEWNCVYLDGNWYYIDVTWDDPVVSGTGILPSSYHYKYFLKGSETFNKDHVVKTQFVDGGKNFAYPTISVVDY